MRKKKILWHSNFAGAPTGFGAFTKYILSYLYRTGKYELCNYAAGLPFNGSPDAARFPWKTIGTIPTHRPEIIQRINQDPNYARLATYGEAALDEAILTFKPDVYIGCEDFWGVTFAIDKLWFSKISSIIHWTADSVPLLDDALNKAEKIKYHYAWSSFAEKEFKRISEAIPNTIENKEKIDGYQRVSTIPGCVNNNVFKRLPDIIRDELRYKYGFDKDTFIISTASRNQLRKCFGPQIQAFGIFKNKYPNLKTKLIFWTDEHEGWDLKKHCEEYNVDINDVLVACRCRVTGEIFYFPVTKEERDHPAGHKKSIRSVGMGNFATDEDINNFLNLSDVFMLHITSGGFELNLSQAKLTEIPTIANSYSCFDDQVGIEKGTLISDEHYYYECGSNFKKATPDPISIANNIEKVFLMTPQQRRQVGLDGRKFVLNNYAIEVIGKKFEELLDSLPFTDYDFSELERKENPNRNPFAEIPNIENNDEWVTHIYRNILGRDPDEGGFKTWTEALKRGMPRQQIEQTFRSVATKEDQECGKPAIENFLGPESANERLLLSIPGSAGDLLMCSALLKDARELYPNHKIYFGCDPKFFEILAPAVPLYLDKLIPYTPEMNNPALLEGAQGAKKYFDIAIALNVNTQMILNYYRGGKDTSNINLKY